MTNRDWAILAFRLLAIWLFTTALVGAAGVPSLFGSKGGDDLRRLALAATLLPVVTALVVGWLVWLKSDSLAARTFPDAATTPAAATFARDGIFGLALAVIGVLLIVEAVPVVFSGLTLFALSRQESHSVFGSYGYSDDQRMLIWSAGAKAETVAGVVRLLLGVALLRQPQRLLRLLTQARPGPAGELRDATASEGRNDESSPTPGA